MGQKIDDYILENPLGAGQDGEVWRATKKSLGKIFAIKFLNSIDKEDKIIRFDREIQILSRLNHPNVIIISDKGEAWNPKTKKLVPYYVMEFLEAEPINIFLQRINKKETLKTFCLLFNQILSALVAAHAMGITHGDIKPANILVISKYKVAKLSDFGFGLLPGEKTLDREIYPGSSYHSPMGLSREASDIHKLGMTFKDCLTLIEPNLSARDLGILNDTILALIRDPDPDILENILSRLENIIEFPQKPEPIYFDQISSLIPEITGPKIGGPEKTWLFRLPIHGDIVLSQRCLSIIDLPEFQQLRILKEFSPFDLVFPSLTQTRFESALSQYGMVIEYLEKLSNLSEFRDIIDPSQLRAAVVLSLTKNIGQYPFSNQILRAARSPLFNPKDRSASIIFNEPLSNMLLRDWGLKPEILAPLLKNGKYADKASSLISSILYGPLSAPRIDFFARLSWIMGISYGFDTKKFINQLRISPEGVELAINIDDLSLIESYLLSFYMLFEKVFNNTAAIAADRMLVHSFRELFQSNVLLELIDKFNEIDFIGECIKCIKRTNNYRSERAGFILKEFSQRKLYKKLEILLTDNFELNDFSYYHFDDHKISIKLEDKFSRIVEEHLPPGSIIFDSERLISSNFFSIPILSHRGILSAYDASPIINNMKTTAEMNINKMFKLFCTEEVRDRLIEKIHIKDLGHIVIDEIRGTY